MAETKAKVGTAYTVFQVDRGRDDAGGPRELLVKVGSVDAVSVDQAIRQLGTEGTYVAVPSRSLRPRTLAVEQVSRVRLT